MYFFKKKGNIMCDEKVKKTDDICTCEECKCYATKCECKENCNCDKCDCKTACVCED